MASRPVKGENLETADLVLEFVQRIKGFPRALAHVDKHQQGEPYFLDFQGLFVFLGVKNKHSSTLHLFLTFLDLNLQLVCLCSKCGIDI